MIIKTKDYGFIAWLILKYKGIKSSNGIKINKGINKNSEELFSEYLISDFCLYNSILKTIIGGKNVS